MRLRLTAFATLAATFIAADPASAGFWNWGCKGDLTLPDFPPATLMFDRMALVVLPRELAKGDIAGLTKDNIAAFAASTDTEGFKPTLTFIRAGYPDQKMVLTEKSSKEISKQNGHVGTRERSEVHSRKTYHLVTNHLRDDPVGADIAMDCVEYTMSAP